jgi:hypothetical protein
MQATLGLAIPRADGTCALGGSAWPGGSPGVTSSGRHLVMWLGIYTFMGSRFGRAGRAMNPRHRQALYVGRNNQNHQQVESLVIKHKLQEIMKKTAMILSIVFSGIVKPIFSQTKISTENACSYYGENLAKSIIIFVTIQEEITIFWADVDFFRLYN